MNNWKCVLVQDSQRKKIGGSEKALADAIRRGADLRVGTEFVHNEHIDVTSKSKERIVEVAEFAVTYLVRDSWSAGIMNLRQPVSLPDRFGPRSSMSLFLYNQDGQHGVARLFLDRASAKGKIGPSALDFPPNMPKYHALSSWDGPTNAPSTNFTYEFGIYRYLVRDSWKEVLSHDANGRVRSGSVQTLAKAFEQGQSVKVAVRDLCRDLATGGEAVDHEVFVQTGSNYYYTKQKVFIAGSHPVIRIKPGMPMRYRSRGWDIGWLVLRSDGQVKYRRCDPYTLAFRDISLRCPIRWFVR
jgi:hypothetical protein